MRAMFLADLHAHVWKQFARTTERGMNSRLLDLIYVLKQCWQEAEDRGLTDVYIAGDLVHVKRHVPVQAVVAVHECLREAKRRGLRVHLVPGNHDQVEDDPSAVTPLLFRDVADVHAEPDDCGDVVYVPWMFDQEKAKKFLAGVKGERELLIYHGEVKGAFVGSTDYPVALRSQVALADLHAEHYHWVMMGHLHRRQQVGAKGRVYYAGNPLSKDRGEPEEDKGALIVDGQELSIFVCEYPKFVTLDLSEDTAAEQLLKGRGNFVTLIAPVDLQKRALEKILDQVRPREVDVIPAPRKQDVKARRTEIRIGQTLEEIMDRYVDESCEDAADAARRKDLGRELRQDLPVEGASH